MDDRTTGASPHELLLALAGRIDDDLLAWCRELVAVGEDGHALEMLTATMIADRTPLPAAERAAVVAAARAARPDLDADAALAAAVTEYGTVHRFDAGPSGDALAVAVGALPARQVAGCRTWVTSRVTPAGTAPGPLPHGVVLVEVGADDARPVDVLAYQIAIACERAGVSAAVEVVVAGAERPEYQQAALRSARPVHGAGEIADTEVPAAAEPDVFAVRDLPPEPDAPSRELPSDEPWLAAEPMERPAPAPAVAEPAEPLWPASGSLVLPPSPEPTPSETTVPEPVDPEPLPARRPFAPLRGLTSPDGPRPGPARTVTPLPRPAGTPSPVPLGRRGTRPLAPVGDEGSVRSLPVPAPGTGAPALASLGDPMSTPIEPTPIEPEPRDTAIDEYDPLGIGRLSVPDEEPALEPTTPAADSWLADWISGDWAMSRSATDPAGAPAPTDAPAPGPSSRTTTAGEPAAARPDPAPAEQAPVQPPPVQQAPVRQTPVPQVSVEQTPVEQAPQPAPRVRPRVEIDRVDPPPPRPARRRPPPARPEPSATPPESALEQTGFILRAESVARLSDSDRELLARLQSEVGEAPRPRVTRRAGIGSAEPAAGTNGRGQRSSTPPDMAG